MEPRVIARAPEGAGCPRCGGFVYAAEQKLARGRVSIYLINYIIDGTRLDYGLNSRNFCAVL